MRFAPDARVADITALLDTYQARSSMAPRAACFGCNSAHKPMTKDEVASLMSRLQNEKIVGLAVPTPLDPAGLGFWSTAYAPSRRCQIRMM